MDGNLQEKPSFADLKSVNIFDITAKIRFLIWWWFNQHCRLVLFLANLDENTIYRVEKMSPFSVQQMEKIVLLSLMPGKNLRCENFYLNFFGNHHLVFVFSAWKFLKTHIPVLNFPKYVTYSKIASFFTVLFKIRCSVNWKCRYSIEIGTYWRKARIILSTRNWNWKH